jgi:hypothetical protein
VAKAFGVALAVAYDLWLWSDSRFFAQIRG